MSELEIEVSAGPVRALPASSALASAQVISGPCYLYGWSVRETTGAAIASAELTSGNAVIGELGMPAGLTDTRTISHRGVFCPGGIKVNPVSGAWQGTLYASYERD